MTITSPIPDGVARVAEILTGVVNSLWKAIGWFDDAVDGGLGMVMSGLAGVAAALLVALLVSIYLRSGYRSTRDIIAHGLAAALLLGLLGFAAYDLRHDALAYLGLNASAPAIKLEIRSPVSQWRSGWL
ncbi:hypothetical protein IC762_15390 [Bradyrhizobium genosp. L]|uniref:hypothetical protein n=1 Tax=Bradyrhizobium genosp. L TaxID=83637 RepID=UPI0018A25ACD|nr:hypothetical protein [Bradyrhizobium genosp. L]QPF87583.1 hypothetical protein IC762_15390 [Bradyrhizobium genosp. L]